MGVHSFSFASSFDQSKYGSGRYCDVRKIVVLCKFFQSLQNGLYFIPPFEIDFLELKKALPFVLRLKLKYSDLNVIFFLWLFSGNDDTHFLSFLFGLDEICYFKVVALIDTR